MKYLLLTALLVGGCATTANQPTMQDAIDIQLQRDFEKEQQKRVQDIINDNIIQSQII
ncbi:hypothetical protein [Psychrobacter sp. Rd 27.2]|uniref:hypothetical protein n=1 Tax=Psychrobacter sp. Rd 27.2 TaxID=1926479 RepID=UPI000AF08E41|nr:hypothetical protein [Psychrobacter sp. Rd 27.2]